MNSWKRVARLFAGLALALVLGSTAQAQVPRKTTIKGIHADGSVTDPYTGADVMAGNETGWVSVAFNWHELVGDESAASHRTRIELCVLQGYQLYTDTTTGVTECFRTPVLAKWDQHIAEYDNRGVRLIGGIVHVPQYARVTDTVCARDGKAPIDPTFCAPSVAGDSQDPTPGVTWLRVAAKFLAQRYRGKIAAWVIMNEVNYAGYFSIGCQSPPCTDPNPWIQRYADTFNAAYDGIMEGTAIGDPLTTPSPAVLAPIAGFFDTPWDTARELSGTPTPWYSVRTVSVKTFLRGFHQKVSPRKWQLATHAYPRDIRVPFFTADDLTRPRRDHPSAPHEGYADNFPGNPPPGARGSITHATVGAMVGFVRQEFPAAWPVYMTEGGLNTLKPAWSDAQYPELAGQDYEALQQSKLCDVFRNYLGTPGIEAMLIQRSVDNTDPQEIDLRLGLFRIGSPPTTKPAWATYALANRYESAWSPPPSCGFEHLPYTLIKRASSPSGHRISSRVLTPESSLEVTWYLLRDERPTTRALYECWVPGGATGRTFATSDAGCLARANSINLGPIGYAYEGSERPKDESEAVANAQWARLYDCALGNIDNIVTESPTCEGWGSAATATFLGWARRTTSNADNSRYTRLRRSSKPATPQTGIPLHWTTTVLPPIGFSQEAAWWILRDPEPGTKLYYECEYLGHSFPSEREDCEYQKKLGPLGYIAQSPTGGAPLYRCSIGWDHMVTSDPNCEGWYKPYEVFLGYASVR